MTKYLAMEQRKKQTSVQIRDLVIQYFEGDENGKKSEREVAKLLKIPKSTVHSIISKYKRTGKVEDLKGRVEKLLLVNVRNEQSSER